MTSLQMVAWGSLQGKLLPVPGIVKRVVFAVVLVSSVKCLNTVNPDDYWEGGKLE